MRKLANIVRINFPELPKLTSLGIIQGTFMQEKCWNIVRTAALNLAFKKKFKIKLG